VTKTRRSGLEKRDIALAQLRRAIQLFRKGDFVCATTLAGAAEEILGRIASKRAGFNALDGDEAFAEQFAAVVGAATPDKAKIRRVMNLSIMILARTIGWWATSSTSRSA
jgi:hypothetical protein